MPQAPNGPYPSASPPKDSYLFYGQLCVVHRNIIGITGTIHLVRGGPAWFLLVRGNHAVEAFEDLGTSFANTIVVPLI